MDPHFRNFLSFSLGIFVFITSCSENGKGQQHGNNPEVYSNDVSNQNDVDIGESDSADTPVKTKRSLQEIVDDSEFGDSIILFDLQSKGTLVLRDRKNLHIKGDKLKTFLINNDSGYSTLFIDNCENISISGITLKQLAEFSDASTITINRSTNIVISNCDISSDANSGIKISESEDVNIKNNYIHHCNDWGLIVAAKNINISDNTFSANGAEAESYAFDVTIYEEASSNIVFQGNVFADVGIEEVDSIENEYTQNISDILSFDQSNYFDAFFDYVVTDTYKGKMAKADFSITEFPEKTKSLIRSKYKSLNWAGHYSFIPIKNKNSFSSAAVDVITGKVFKGVFSRTGFEYYTDSELLVANPEINPDLFPDCDTCLTRFYKLEDTVWVELYY